jgi:Heterokaryon incompatibility protein (HET)
VETYQQEILVRLCNGVEAQGAGYATLSHCWGKAKFLALTTHNIQQFQSGITLQSLPRTFRDALRITLELGLRYIWIDSLALSKPAITEKTGRQKL